MRGAVCPSERGVVYKYAGVIAPEMRIYLDKYFRDGHNRGRVECVGVEASGMNFRLVCRTGQAINWKIGGFREGVRSPRRPIEKSYYPLFPQWKYGGRRLTCEREQGRHEPSRKHRGKSIGGAGAKFKLQVIKLLNALQIDIRSIFLSDPTHHVVRRNPISLAGRLLRDQLESPKSVINVYNAEEIDCEGRASEQNLCFMNEKSKLFRKKLSL